MPSSSITYTNNVNVLTTSAHDGRPRQEIYNLSLTITEQSYDIETNMSTILLTGIFRIINSGWNPAFTSHTVTFTTYDVADNNRMVCKKTISNAYYGTNYTSCNVTLQVPHGNDGTKHASYKTVIGSSTSYWYLPTNGSNVTTEGDLTVIPRMTDFTVEPSDTVQGTNVTINRMTPALSSYRHSLYYVLGDNPRVDIWTKSTNTSTLIAWEQIRNAAGANVTKTMAITMETYASSSASTPLGSITKTLTVITGKIPISMYDDGLGNVGVTMGAKAESSGLSIQMPTSFGTSTASQNVDFAYANILNWSLRTPVDLVWDGSNTLGEWDNAKKYAFYIFNANVKSLSSNPGSVFMSIAPTSMFGTADSTNYRQRIQLGADGEYVTFSLWISTDGKGHFNKQSPTSTSTPKMLRVWGVGYGEEY